MPHHSVARAVELAVLGEQFGYERCWVYDEGLAAHDVYVTMAAIASATTTLEIGPGITNPYTRHAGATAAAIASLDELSGGRAFLGIGAGGSLTLDPLMIERRRPLAAVRETIKACRQLFSGETVTTQGSMVSLQDASLLHARPSTEIWLAGRGPKMLELGGSACDGVFLDFVFKPDIPEIIEHIHDAGWASGLWQTGPHKGEPRKARITYSTMLVTDDESMACAKLNMTYRLVDSPPEVQQAIGMTPADALALRSALAHGLEVAAELVRDEWVLPFVISGPLSACHLELRYMADHLGIESFVVPLLDDDLALSLLHTGTQVLGLQARPQPGDYD